MTGELLGSSLSAFDSRHWRNVNATGKAGDCVRICVLAIPTTIEILAIDTPYSNCYLSVELSGFGTEFGGGLSPLRRYKLVLIAAV